MRARTPRFSVVVPTRDRPEWLAAAVESVLEQSYPDFELWIVDDASAVGTAQVCARWEGDPRIHVLRNERSGGAAAARNRAIRSARGDYVAFLDDDCVWHPDRLARVDALLRSRGDRTGYVATQTVLLSVGSPPRYELDPILPEGDPPWRVGAPMIVARRELLLELGGFDERLPRSHDWDLAIRLVDRSGWALLREPLVWAEDLPGLTADAAKIQEASRVLLEKYGRSSPISRALTVALHRAFAHKMLMRHHGPEGRRHYGRAAALAPAMLVNWVTLVLALGGTRLYRVVTGLVGRARGRRDR